MSMGSPRASCDLVLTDVLFPDGRVADISVKDGRVIHVGAGYTGDSAISCRGKLVLPGALDMHVHMRGGVQSDKEDWTSGSRSALAGGVTMVVDQPNTLPPLNTADTFRKRVAEAAESSLCSFAINGGVTGGNDLDALWKAGALAFGEIFAAPSSYGESLHGEALRGALSRIRKLDALATIHAEEVIQGNASSLTDHNALRPPGGEAAAVRKVQELNSDECRIHFCHISSAAAVAEAGRATVEVTPHHLFLSLERCGDPDDAYCKVNPPVRREQERRDLWCTWDRIDVIASDHAPHTLPEKNAGFSLAPSGIPGVETMVPLLLNEWLHGRVTLSSIIEKTSYKPSDILGIRRAGFIPGDRADFAIYGKEAAPIHAEDLHSKAAWTPYENFPAIFPQTVIMAGIPSYHCGDFFPSSPAWHPGQGFLSVNPHTPSR